MADSSSRFADHVGALQPGKPTYATEVVDLILAEARALGASDVHLLPTEAGLELRWRIDGVLSQGALLPSSSAPNIVARLKVLANLLTYRTEVPQEGRIPGLSGDLEMRLSVFPTLYGEKAVIRLFAASGHFLHLENLGLPEATLASLRKAITATSGAILLSGPAGSGKTTTIYACLRELVATTQGSRNLATLEDPIEVPVPGVAQSQVNLSAGFTFELGLRSLLRQDPEVIAVGEVRDPVTAEIAFQASLTGHLVLTTFHAGHACGVLGRLIDMGIEPYLIRSGTLAILCQRLLRTLCTCAVESTDPSQRLGLEVERVRLPVGCALCAGTGYRGRMLLAEMLEPRSHTLGEAILARADVGRLQRLAIESGMTDLWSQARSAVEAGRTSPAEVRRVLGID